MVNNKYKSRYYDLNLYLSKTKTVTVFLPVTVFINKITNQSFI